MLSMPSTPREVGNVGRCRSSTLSRPSSVHTKTNMPKLQSLFCSTPPRRYGAAMTVDKRQRERGKRELAMLVHGSIGSWVGPAGHGAAHMRGLHITKPLPSFSSPSCLRWLSVIPCPRLSPDRQ
jgi:hypothetical protein